MRKLQIVVNPLGSKFAKALQGALQPVVRNQVRRSRRVFPLRHNFVITPRGMDKIEQLTRFQANGVSCPKFTTDAARIGELESKVVFARTLVNSTNGRGIKEFEWPTENIPRAPLYTEYIPKKAEYRVHVFGGEVIDVQEKRKKRGFDGDRDTRVRNCANGYVYCRDGIVPPDGIHALAVNAVQALGYDYGAVDIIHNERRGACYVLEVNSRPGLMGSTLERYRDAMIARYNLTRA